MMRKLRALTSHRTWKALRAGGSRFSRNLVLVARANVIAQAIPLLAAPILTRLYSPADFGVLAVFTALVALLVSFSTARAEWSVPNAHGPRQAASLIMLGSFMLAAVTTTTVFISGPALSALGGKWGGAALLEPYAALLPLALVMAGLSQLLHGWHVRSGDLKVASTVKVKKSIGSTVATIAFGLAGFGTRGILLGMVIGATFGVSTLYRRAIGLAREIKHVRLLTLRRTMRVYRSELLNSSLASVANAFSLAAIPLLLTHFYPPGDVGHYALMQRIAIGPVSFISSAIAQSFWAEAADRLRQDPSDLYRLYRHATRRLLLLAIPFGVLLSAGPWYVSTILGPGDWDNAGWILAALAPVVVAQLIVSPLSHLIVHRLQHTQLAWDLARLSSLVLTVALASALGATISACVLALSVVGALFYVALFFINVHAYPKELRG